MKERDEAAFETEAWKEGRHAGTIWRHRRGKYQRPPSPRVRVGAALPEKYEVEYSVDSNAVLVSLLTKGTQ